MQVSADEMHTALIDIISDNRYVRIVKTINTSFERFWLSLEDIDEINGLKKWV